MKLRAQNTIEIVSLVVIVAVVVIAVFMFMNGNKSANLANLSEINTIETSNNMQGTNGTSTNIQTSANSKIDVETAGSLSSIIVQMNENDIKKALLDKSIEEISSVKSSDDEDIFDLANKLITELSLPVSPFDKADLPSNAKETLVKIAVDAKTRLGDNQNQTYTMYTAVLAKIIS